MLAKALDLVDDNLDGGPDATTTALAVLRMYGISNIDLSNIGPTDPNAILDEEVRARRPPPNPYSLDMFDPLDEPVSVE